MLDGTLAMAVDEDGALCGLFLGVAADVDESLDYIVEGVHIVVEEHQ